MDRRRIAPVSSFSWVVAAALLVSCASQPVPAAPSTPTSAPTVAAPATAPPATPAPTELLVPTAAPDPTGPPAPTEPSTSPWPAEARISVGDGSAAETDPFVHVPVMLNMPLAADLDVPFVATGISAVDGREFATHGGTVTIPAGAISTDIAVELLDDTTTESRKVFLVEIKPQIRATRLLGLAYVVDDDSDPSVSIDRPTARRSDGSIRFTLTLSNASDFPVTVRYATNDGTARHGRDYLPRTGRIAGTCPVIEIPQVWDLSWNSVWYVWGGGGSSFGTDYVTDGLKNSIPCGVLFRPGVTSMTIDIPLVPGARSRSDRTLGLHLLDRGNARIDTIGTILADD